MPTDFTRSMELISTLETALALCTDSISAEDGKSLKAIIDEIESNMPKFQRRITDGIYNVGMVAKVNDLMTRVEAAKYKLLPLLTLKRKHEEEIVTHDDPPLPPTHAQTSPLPQLQTSPVKEKLSVAPAISSTSASPRKVVGSFVDIETTEHVSQKSGAFEVAFAITKEFVDIVAKNLQISTEVPVTRKNAMDILFAIQSGRIISGLDKDSPGWRKWASVEAEAAFLLIDRDQSDTMEYEEFCSFAYHHPQLFGPLYHISRLFEAFDSNQDGALDRDELFNLLLDIEVNTSDETADPPAIMARVAFLTASLLSTFDGDRSGDISFLEFIKAIHSHPELLCHTHSMRSHFEAADVDSNGSLTETEVEAMLRNMMQISGTPVPTDLSVEIARIFAFCDDNKDGRIEYPEFVKYFVRSNAEDSNVLPFFSLLLAWPSGGKEDIQAYFSKSLQKEYHSLQSTVVLSVDECATCFAPLVGSQGITKFGRSYCGASCMSRFKADAEEHAKYHSKYDSAGFRAVTHGDFDGPWKRYITPHKRM